MRQQISKELFAHWRDIKGARLAPDRADIGPAAIRHILADLLLLPLRYFGKTHARVLGALAPVYQPEWFGQLRAGPLSLISMRVLDFASAPPRAPEPARSERTRPRLVVYEGDKLR